MAHIEESPILTIAIPTYNRASYLNRNLDFLWRQLRNNAYSVEVIVSDNASVDNTKEIVDGYIKSGFNITYLRNKENLGFDGNFIQCYQRAKGKYILALSDDDLLLEGAIDKITSLLVENEYGVVYLNGYIFKSDPLIEQPTIQDGLGKELYIDPYKFIKRISYYITFISGNIVNSEFLENSEIEKYRGTSLCQVSFILTAVFSSKLNLFVKQPLLAVQADNSGGYSLFKVFGVNFYKILVDVERKYNRSDFKDYIITSLLFVFIPGNILKIKKGNSNFSGEDVTKILRPVFGRYIWFWILCVPVNYLPLPFARWYFAIVKKFRKVALFLQQ